MNIFVLDRNPKIAAQQQCDVHVVKMALETAQILCTASYINGFYDERMYKPTHEKHPCVDWASRSRANYAWLLRHGFALCDEYSFRYGKEHASRKVIDICKKSFEMNKHLFNCSLLTNFSLAMPDIFKQLDEVKSYRDYYREKQRILKRFTYKKPERKPTWL